MEKCPIKCDIHTLWHGTTLGRAKKILEEGFIPLTLMEGGQAGEGYSSCHYEGGLFFFGKDNKSGRTMAHRHAYRAGRQFNDKSALLKITACVCNELTNDMITEDFKQSIYKKADKELRESGGKILTGHRFTYNPIRGDFAYKVLENGVMTSYCINMAMVMKWLGYDAVDGFEGVLGRENISTSTMLNSNEPIMEIELIELPEHEEIPEVGY